MYGVIVFCRNKLYAFKILKSVEFHLPVISVGNITVGGTGKTPHTEYLIRLLKDDFKVAFLSRGYKRKTSGFILATEQSSADVIGDEPFQIKRKFPELPVAVDSNRVKGINKLLENLPEIDIIVLDDAYQHRRVTPGVNILLIDYNKPIHTDSMLPYGLLREPASEKKRADIVIVTKVPKNISAMEKRLFEMHSDLMLHQKIYFTTIKYGKPIPVFDTDKKHSIDFSNKKLNVLLVTGIAQPEPLIKHLSSAYLNVIPVVFPDHYSFTAIDIEKIIQQFSSIPEDDKVIITTEKDAARLLPFNFEQNIPEAWYYIPIEIDFLADEADQFNHQILHYVNNNSKNSILYKK